ncbi:MFS general substrate transporter [Rickenella mellea]|uniref:MFS general substrate transporter n=1 Tax=Rickenella mellea TaxID=50990 RepID=A0A4Y7QNL1_9AGAM|nr:MFS general substrate transporter [Rickenella mellea]
MKISDSSQAEVPCTSSSESHVAQIPASEKESECCAPLCSPTGTHRDSLTPITPPPDLHIEKTSANLAGYLTLPTVTYEPNGSPTESTTPTYYSSSPNHKHGSHDNNPLPTCNYPERQSWRLASSFFLFFVCGWGDGVTGAMLPHFQTDLHLTYTTSSILFIASSAGFTVGTLLLERVLHFMGRIHMPDVGNNHVSILSLRFQRRKSRLSHSLHIADSHSPSRARSIVLIIFSVCHATFFILMGTKSYPALIAAYAVAAFSRAFLTGQVNAYVAATPKRPLGQLHGCWGFGAFAAPLVCQSILAKGVPWTNFYFGSLVLSAINTALLTYSFRPTSLERAIDNLAATHCRDSNLSDSASSPITESEKGANCETLDAPKSRTLKLALTSPYVWAFSIFAWIYSGGETVTAGYIVTYVLHVRHANPQTAGYVSSGFWAGITISRVTYGFLSPKLLIRPSFLKAIGADFH